MRLFIIGLVLVAGCGAMNPMANRYISKMKAEGMRCVSYEYEGETLSQCYTIEERLQLYEDQRVWTRAEKAMLAATLFCQVGDVVTTKLIIDDGGREVNPLYGSDPNLGVISAAKVLLTTGLLIVADAAPFERKKLLAGYGITSCLITSWNASQVDW